MSEHLILYQNDKITSSGTVFAGFVLAIIFILIGHVYRDTVQQRLKSSLIHIPAFDLDYWSISHFLLFAFFGYVKPGYPLSFFVAGCLFEVFEDMLSSDETTKLMNCMDADVKNSPLGKVYCNGYSDSYWYGKVDDIAINLIGYVTGQAVRQCF